MISDQAKAALDKFGAFVVHNLRDRMLDDVGMLLDGKWKALELMQLQDRLAQLNDVQKELVREVVDSVSIGGMHDLLFALQEDADANGPIRVLVDGQEVAKSSDGMHGELFGEDGWMVRFSNYPCEREIERSREAEEWVRQTFGKKEGDRA